MLLNNKHITYCSNIFKEKNTKKLINKLNEYIFFIKKKLKIKKISLGLCLSNEIVKNLLKYENAENFTNWLKYNQIYLSSINGFVYQNFHTRHIKEKIYYPDWSSLKRLNYTQKIIDFLLKIQNNTNDISISTLPISFKNWMNNRNKKYIYFYSSINFIKIVKKLISIKKYIHIDIEPEPGCLIESIQEFYNFYYKWLKKIYMQNKNNKYSNLKKHITLCYDICHALVSYDSYQNIIKKIKIGKVQISSAIEIINNDTNRISNINELSFLNESNFLHQNTTIDKNNKIIKKNIDINLLINKPIPLDTKTRIHCHMPIYLKKYNNLIITQQETKNILIDILKNLNVKHIELESYTYNMILKQKKLNSILKEYLLIIKWLKNV